MTNFRNASIELLDLTTESTNLFMSINRFSLNRTVMH